MPDQSQRSGDESANVQAGRDATVIFQGLTLAEARDVALDVFRANFIDLRGIAEDVARSRAEKITEDFLRELESRFPQGLNTAADPDMQRALLHAQAEFACSGEEDLEGALVDLLVDRASEADRGIRTLTLNQAIDTAPKLTVAQRRAIAVCFLYRYTTWNGPHTCEAYYHGRLRVVAAALGTDLPKHESAYQHIVSIGAGADAIGPTVLASALLHHDPGWFTQGFTREQATSLGAHIDDDRIVRTCIRNPDQLQLTAMNEPQVERLTGAGSFPELKGALKTLLRTNLMSAEAVRQEALTTVPDCEPLFEAWDHTMLGRLTLTTVGTAIGHAYWRRTTGGGTPLSVWIPD